MWAPASPPPPAACLWRSAAALVPAPPLLLGVAMASPTRRLCMVNTLSRCRLVALPASLSAASPDLWLCRRSCLVRARLAPLPLAPADGGSTLAPPPLPLVVITSPLPGHAEHAMPTTACHHDNLLSTPVSVSQLRRRPVACLRSRGVSARPGRYGSCLHDPATALRRLDVDTTG
jgi:hypothetical protein